MVHVSPWEATLGLLAGAARVLPRGGPLVLYGPYRRDGVPTAASNEAFDASLKARDPRWGLRRVEDRSEEHTSELQSLMRISYAVFCLNKKINDTFTFIDFFHVTPAYLSPLLSSSLIALPSLH